MASQASKAGPEDLDGATTPATEKTYHDDHTNDTPPKLDDLEPETSKSKTILVMISVFLSMFLVGLDRTIISTVRIIKTPARMPVIIC